MKSALKAKRLLGHFFFYTINKFYILLIST